LTTKDGPVQQSVANGLSIAASSHRGVDDATPRFWKSAIKCLLAVADGGSEMVNATCCPSFSLARLDCSAAAPSRMMTSCDASILAGRENRGAGLLPNLAMWATAVSVSTELGMSRRSLPYRCRDVCERISRGAWCAGAINADLPFGAGCGGRLLSECSVLCRMMMTTATGRCRHRRSVGLLRQQAQ
jgi:hypothetical protein